MLLPSGPQVSIFYDPMIAKLVCWGGDRAQALKRMSAALAQYQIVGPPTNIAFVQKCVEHPAFAKGMVDTSFIAVSARAALGIYLIVSDIALVAPGCP